MNSVSYDWGFGINRYYLNCLMFPLQAVVNFMSYDKFNRNFHFRNTEKILTIFVLIENLELCFRRSELLLRLLCAVIFEMFDTITVEPSTFCDV